MTEYEFKKEAEASVIPGLPKIKAKFAISVDTDAFVNALAEYIDKYPETNVDEIEKLFRRAMDTVSNDLKTQMKEAIFNA